MTCYHLIWEKNREIFLRSILHKRVKWKKDDVLDAIVDSLRKICVPSRSLFLHLVCTGKGPRIPSVCFPHYWHEKKEVRLVVEWPSSQQKKILTQIISSCETSGFSRILSSSLCDPPPLSKKKITNVFLFVTRVAISCPPSLLCWKLTLPHEKNQLHL